jgi:hypothetical protein
LHSSPNVITIIKLRTMRWARHVMHMWEIRYACITSVEKPEGRSHSGNIGMGGMTKVWCEQIFWTSELTNSFTTLKVLFYLLINCFYQCIDAVKQSLLLTCLLLQ